MIPGLRQDRVVSELLRALQQPERLVVRRLGAAHPRVETADGLDVVVEHFGPGGEHRPERLLLPVEEVRGQHLDRGLRQLRLQRADRRRVMAGAAVL